MANAVQTLQGAIKCGQHGAKVVLTHYKHMPVLVPLLQSVLELSNKDGQITALFPSPHQAMPRLKRVFDVTVLGEVDHGLRLEARHLKMRQEVYAATSYTAEEMQYILDVHLGKYNFRKRKATLDHLTDCRPSEELFPNSYAKGRGGNA